MASVPPHPQIPKGAVVQHKTKGFEGVIVGTTTLKHLFENPQSEQEYRIEVGPGDIRIAPRASLVIVVTEDIPRSPLAGYESHCWSCNSDIDDSLQRCGSCGWFICAVCGACAGDCVRGPGGSP